MNTTPPQPPHPSQADRRRLLRGLLAGLGGASVFGRASAAPARGRVVVVGGGFAGAYCARQLRLLAPSLAVTLIEPRGSFMTGPLSNGWLVDAMTESSLVRSAWPLAAQGVQVERQAAVELDPVRRRVRTADGRWHTADWLVLAPGISLRWGAIEGLDARTTDAMPHAWLGDHQAALLRQRLQAVPDGATVVVVAPQNPYRCPPGPYERATLFANWLARNRRGCKLLLLDAKDDFPNRSNFQLVWDTRTPGMVEWVPRAAGGEVLSVDASGRRLRLARGDTVDCDLASVIPLQAAGELARAGGVADVDGWCPVDLRRFESKLHPGVFVIGDSAAAMPMPKAAFGAVAHAGICAAAIAADAAGRPSASEQDVAVGCYSLMAADDALRIMRLYRVQGGRYVQVSETTSGGADNTATAVAQEARAAQAGLLQMAFGS